MQHDIWLAGGARHTLSVQAGVHCLQRRPGSRQGASVSPAPVLPACTCALFTAV